MASNQKNHAVPQNKPPISEEVVLELLSVQRQELQIRLEEIKRDNAEINLNKSIAQQSIEAQERDRKHEREEQTKRQRSRQSFLLIAAIAMLLFAGFAVHRGEKELILDIVKLLAGFVAGAGYQSYKNYGRRADNGE